MRDRWASPAPTCAPWSARPRPSSIVFPPAPARRSTSRATASPPGCAEYDCGADSYHAFSAGMFERTSRAIKRALRHHRGLGLFHLYGEGATDEDDPDDRVHSPLEALEKRKRAGFTHVIDIPYEFDSDSRDTLIVLRRGYERPIPDWNRRYESRFRRDGLRVKITNASFGSKLKTLAFEKVAVRAIEVAMAGR